jgi:S-DNA-T family DNA segregation ATPase FtsK/SpoIIIE
VLPDGSVFQLAVHDVGAVASASAREWPGRRVPAIRPLPQRVAEPTAAGDGAFPLGIAIGSSGRHEPVLVDLLAPGAHLAITGDARSGRSTVLRRALAHLAAGPVDLIVLDPRRSLLDASRSAAAHGSIEVAHRPDEIGDALERACEALSHRHSAEPSGNNHRPLVIIADDIDLIDAALDIARRPGPGRVSLGAVAALLPWSVELALHLLVAGPATGRVSLDPLGPRLRAAAALELALPTAYDPALRRSADPQPAGRGRLLRTGERPISMQCFT